MVRLPAPDGWGRLILQLVKFKNPLSAVCAKSGSAPEFTLWGRLLFCWAMSGQDAPIGVFQGTGPQISPTQCRKSPPGFEDAYRKDKD